MLYSNGQFFQGTFCVDNATENETCQIPPWKIINRQVEYEYYLKLIEKGFLHYSFTSIRQHPNNKSLIISRFFRLVIIITFFRFTYFNTKHFDDTNSRNHSTPNFQIISVNLRWAFPQFLYSGKINVTSCLESFFFLRLSNLGQKTKRNKRAKCLFFVCKNKCSFTGSNAIS